MRTETTMLTKAITIIFLTALLLLSRNSSCSGSKFRPVELLNVSYDRPELYQEYNAAFAAYWKAKTGEALP